MVTRTRARALNPSGWVAMEQPVRSGSGGLAARVEDDGLARVDVVGRRGDVGPGGAAGEERGGEGRGGEEAEGPRGHGGTMPGRGGVVGRSGGGARGSMT